MKLSISYRIGIILASVLVLSISSMLFVLLSQEEQLKKEKARESIQELSTSIHESVKYMMGEGVTNAAPIIEKLSAAKNIRELQLKAGDAIKPGGNAKFDPDEQKAFTSGVPVVISEHFNKEDVIRSIEPIKAENSCVTCHNTQAGSPLAVISMRYSMESTNDFIASQRVKAAIMLLITVLISFWVIMYFLRKNIITVLHRSMNKIKDIAQAIGNLTHAMNLLSKGHLNAAITSKVEKMQVTATDEFGELEQNLNLIIDNFDSVTLSFEDTRQEIDNIINETNKLTGYAKDGKLHERGDLNKFTGAYRELLSGINTSFDQIAAPLQHSTDVLNELAKGDFTINMHGEYKGVNLVMKDSINKLVDAMNMVFADIRHSLVATKNTADLITRMSVNLVHDAHHQKSEIEEVASATEQMSRTISSSTQNIANATNLSLAAAGDADKGARMIQDSISGMIEAKQHAQTAEEVINRLVAKTEQIGNVTTVIAEISEQTNLLALNAAIEAARAGENGRGFAIVADEVRKLADRTGKATKEIEATIKEIQSESEKAYNSMLTTGKAVDSSVMLTEQLKAALLKMAETVTTVSDRMHQLNAAAEEQTTTSEQICRSMDNIATVTDRFVISTEEFEKTAEELRHQTEHLNESLSRFRVNEIRSRRSAAYMLEN